MAGLRTRLRWRVVASLCALGLVAAVLLPSAAPAAGSVDEIHYTFTSATSVAFDWRGAANDIRYGLTASYGTTVAGHQPTPLPFSSPGPFWEAELTGLAPGTSYHYSIGGGPDMVFSTAPTGNFRFAAIADVGDSGSYPQVATVQSQIAADDPAFVLVNGDISYGNDHGQEVVDQHFNDVMAWSRRAAYMPSWGNHEWDDERFDDLRNYKGRFALPNPQTSPFSPFAGCCGEDWSWFDAGGVRFISYPEPFTGAWSDWRTKADAVMAAAQGDPGIHFIVTVGHRPAYSTGNHPGSGTLAGILDALGDRYPKYLLNINGHTHSYERFAPIHGVTHITAAGGGATLQPPWKTTDARTAYRAMHHAYLRVDVTASSMRIAAICGPPTPEDDITCTLGEVIDSTTIMAPAAGSSQVVNVAVAASSDDAEERGTSVDLSSSDLEVVTDGTVVQTVGLRFPAVAVPRGAVIQDAYVQFQTDEVSTDTASITVQGQAADSAATFANTTRNVSTRPRTTASVRWTPPAWTTEDARGPDQRTPNLAAVVQEIVNRTGWSSGNALALVLTGSGRRTAEAWDGTNAPTLRIEYTT